MNMTLEELKKIKEAKKLTLDFLSKKLNLQASSIARWLRTGKINPFYEHYLKGKIDALKTEVGYAEQAGQG